MAESVTKWILEMVDKITAPVRSVEKAVDSTTDAIDAMTDAVKFNEKETAEAVTNAKSHYDDLNGKLNQAKGEMLRLGKAAKAATGTAEQKQANEAYEVARQKVERLSVAVKEAKEDIDSLTESQDNFKQTAKTSWSEAITGANQGVELVQKAADKLDFAVHVAKLTTEIQRMTDVTGPALDDMVAKTRRVAAVYDEDAEQVARAANAMTEQIGGSFEDNLALIDQGFQKGANINGDFLDQLREYPTFIKQLGLSQSEAIALIAQAGKKGVFSDKAIDSIKEATLSLKEMGKPQQEALAGIGIDYNKDIAGKLNPMEAVKLITQKMKGATTQARQLIIADIFKGAGEDAGATFIDGLSNMDLDLTHLKSVEEAGAGIKGFFSDISTWVGQTFGDVAIYAQQLAPVFQIIAAGIPIMEAMTVSQWSLNAAMDANPVGFIIAAIVALIALVTVIIQKYDEWGAALAFLIGPIGWIINLVMTFKKHWDSIEEAFTKGGIVGGIKRIGVVLLDAILYPVQQLLELLAKIPGLGGLAGDGAKFIKEMRENLDLTEADTKPEDKPSVNAYATQTEKLDKAVTDPAKAGKTGDGLNVGSGSGGIKNITMTLNISNHFSVGKGTDTRAIADKIVGNVNDRLRDAVINLGA